MNSKKVLVTGVKSGLGKYIYNLLPGCTGLVRENRKDIIEKNDSYDLIIHCAFKAQGAGKNNINDYYKYVDDNILLTKELTSLKHNKFVYISSIIAYSEEVSAYKYSKLFSEAIVEKTSNSPLIVRCSSLLGEAMRYNTLMKIINDETSEITLTKDSTYNFIRHSDLLEFILKAAKKDVTGVVDFVASDYIELKEVVDRLNSSVAYGSYTFKTPNASNTRLVNMFPEYNKSSWEALGEFLEEIK